MKKTIFTLLTLCAIAAVPVFADVETVEETGNFEALTPIKLRKEPSVKSANIKCHNMAVNNCQSSACSGESAVIPKGSSVQTARRTTKEEKNSGAKGYWYQMDGQHNCNAWIFGGLLKKIQ